MNIEYVASTMVFWWRENKLSFEQECEFLRSLDLGVEVWPTIKNDYECRFEQQNWNRLKDATKGMTTVLRARTDEPDIKKWREQAECAKLLNARIVADFNSLKIENSTEFDGFSFASKAFQICKDRDVKISLITGDLPTIEQLLEKFDHLNVCFNVGYANIADDFSFREYVHRLAPRIDYLHLNDNFGHMDDHQPPGLEGGIALEDWQYLLNALNNSEHNIIGSLEVAPSMPHILIKRSHDFLFNKMNWPNPPAQKDNMDFPIYRPD